ncbi:hypothetical protein KC960_04495 [Candidatus Saccharibacteria bacterium]|nr:hypothetical protein [Candidatus Saccharibacteria bacterium]
MIEVFDIHQTTDSLVSQLLVDGYEETTSGLVIPKRLIELTKINKGFESSTELVLVRTLESSSHSEFGATVDSVISAITGFCVNIASDGELSFNFPDENMTLIPKTVQEALPDPLQRIIRTTVNPGHVGQYL